MAAANSTHDKPWFQVVLRDKSEGCKIPLFPVVQCDHTGSGRARESECATKQGNPEGTIMRRGGIVGVPLNGMKRKDQIQNSNPKTRTKNKRKIKEIDFTYPDGEVERQGDRSEIGRREWQPCSRDQMLSVSPRSHENRP